MKNVLLITLLSIGLIACEGEGDSTESVAPAQGIEGLQYKVDYDYVGGPTEIPINSQGGIESFPIDHTSTGELAEACGTYFYKTTEGKLFGVQNQLYSDIFRGVQLGSYSYDWGLGGYQELLYTKRYTLVVGKYVVISEMSSYFQNTYGHIQRVTNEDDRADNCILIVDEFNNQVRYVNILTEEETSIFSGE